MDAKFGDFVGKSGTGCLVQIVVNGALATKSRLGGGFQQERLLLRDYPSGPDATSASLGSAAGARIGSQRTTGKYMIPVEFSKRTLVRVRDLDAKGGGHQPVVAVDVLKDLQFAVRADPCGEVGQMHGNAR